MFCFADTCECVFLQVCNQDQTPVSFDGGMLHLPDIELDLLSWQTLCVALYVKKLIVTCFLGRPFVLHCMPKSLLCVLRSCAVKEGTGSTVTIIIFIYIPVKQTRRCITNFSAADMSGCDLYAKDDCWHYGR